MAGQLVRRGRSTWLLRVYLGRSQSTGRRKYLNKTVHGSKKDAQKVLTDLLKQKDMGVLFEHTRETLDDFLDRWLEAAAKPGVRQRTFDDYKEALNRYVRPKIGGRLLSQVTPVEVQTLYSSLLDRGLSPQTVRHVHAVLRNALGQAVRWRLITQNPAEFVDLPRAQRPRNYAMSPKEADRFLEAAKDDVWYPLWALLISTGLRPGEALALHWRDVDLESGTVTVRQALAGRGGKWRLEEPKTAGARRRVPLPPSTTLALQRHHAALGSDALADDLVFHSSAGTFLEQRNLIGRHFKPILKRAGLPDRIRLYDLRHTSATLLLGAGVHPKIVSERLGHASVALTLDTYSHVLPDMQSEAASHLERLLFRGSEAASERIT